MPSISRYRADGVLTRQKRVSQKLTLQGLWPILRAMPRQPRRTPRQNLGAACLMTAMWVASMPQPAVASPPDSSDPVTKFLAEKGLLALPPEPVPAATEPRLASAEDSNTSTKKPTSAPGFVQQVRDSASDMVLTAMNFLGVPYKRGGNSEETGFDCSGFTRHIFEKTLGLVLPRRADEQAQSSSLMTIAREELKPGDLVFFNTLRRTFSHVGIYVGEGKFIHAPRSGAQVRVEDMRVAYWNQRFTGARRAPQVQANSTANPPSASNSVPTTPNQPATQALPSSTYSGN
jgi:cell wall-associated NlpC family hydrolase